MTDDEKMLTDDDTLAWAEVHPHAREVVYAYLKKVIGEFLVKRAEAEFATVIAAGVGPAVVIEVKTSPEEMRYAGLALAFEAALAELEFADPLICDQCGERHAPEAPHPSTLS